MPEVTTVSTQVPAAGDYVHFHTAAGNLRRWDVGADSVKDVATLAALDTTAPDFIGQLAKVTKGGSWFHAYGTAAGNWSWMAFDPEYDPDLASNLSTWVAGDPYVEGQLVQVPDHVVSTGNTFDASSTNYELELDAAAETTAGRNVDDYFNGCYIEDTTNGFKRRIIDSTASTVSVTVPRITAPSSGDSYEITWRSGKVVYECLADHTADAEDFCADLNHSTPKWKVWVIEDYHYHRRGIGISSLSTGASTPHEAVLMHADRAPDWAGIVEEVWKVLPATASAQDGVTETWGSEYSVNGTIHLTDGGASGYSVSRGFKWPPGCTIAGPNSPSAANKEVCRVRAVSNDLVTYDDGGGTDHYFCLTSHESAAGVTPAGANWQEIEAWSITPSYNGDNTFQPGDVCESSGSYYRCMIAHTPVAGSSGSQPPPGGVVRGSASTGNTWFRYWQKIDPQVAAAWVADTFYTSGWDVEYEWWLIEGVQRKSTDDGGGSIQESANTNFFTGAYGFAADGYSTVRGAFNCWLSQGSRLQDLDADNFGVVGFYIGRGGDDFRVFNCTVQRLGSGSPAAYGWWIEDSVKSSIIVGATVGRCEDAMSFGGVEALIVQGLETEHVATPVRFRQHDHRDLFQASGTGSDNEGSPGGTIITGIRADRHSDNGNQDFVIATRNLAYVRYSSEMDCGLFLSGVSGDRDGNNEFYDQVTFREASGSESTFPLGWWRGYKDTFGSGRDRLSFDVNLMQMLMHRNLLSDYTQEAQSRLLSSAQPVPPLVTDTGGADTNIGLEPGFYRINIDSASTWGTTGFELTMKDAFGNAFPTINGIRAIGSDVDVMYHHPGGNMTYAVATGTGTPSIRMWIRPWLYGGLDNGVVGV